MNTPPTRILIVEDEPAHAEAIRRALLDAGANWDIRVADSLRAYHEAVATGSPDLVLLDYLLPDGRADSLLVSPPEDGPFPMVLMTSHGDEEVAVEAMRRGALDYVVKSPEAFVAMPRTVDRALRGWRLLVDRKQAQQALEREAACRRILIEGSRDGIVVLDQQGKVHEANRKFAEMLGRSVDDIRELHVWDWESQHSREQVEGMLRAVGPAGDHFETIHRRKDGSVFPVEISTNATVLDGQKLIFCVCRDIAERKRFADIIQQSEVRYRNLVETSADWVWEVDANERYTYTSPRVFELLGYAPEEVLGRTPFDFMPETEAQRVAAAFRERATRRELFSCLENINRHKDGRLVILESSGVPILGAQGEFKGYRGMDRNITERKQAEDALRESEERYRRLFEGITDMVFAHELTEQDLPGRFVAVNEATCRQLGYAREDLLHMTIRDIDAPESTVDVRAIVARLRQGEHVLFEQTHVTKDGRRIPVEISAQSFRLQGRLAVFSVARDITERKRVEDALRASEERFRTLVENAPVGIFVQTGGRFTYVNQAALQMFGFASRNQLLGQPVLSRFHPDFQAQVRERIRRLNEERQTVLPAEEKCVRLDGTPFEAEFAAVPFTYDGEHGALVFFQELTERKRLEAQLRQAQKLEAIGQLAGGVAHDFNNILAAIMMHLGLLQMNTALDEETRHALKDLDAEAQRAANLTRQLLMFSRRSVLAVKPLDLNEVVANLLKMLGRLIGEQVNLRFDGTTGLPPVEADAGMLEQVLMNLVVNARDALPKGGRITIATELREMGAEDIAANPDRREGRFVCLAVSDTGTGMDDATLKRIFDPFFTTKEPGKGTGLGLATVHGIAAQHKGWVEVASELGRGSTFRVFLPALSSSPNLAAVAAPVEPIRRGRETILLVEDDAKVRQMIGLALRVLGYRVHEAANGQEAMRLWQSHGTEVDLLLTDMVMPEGMTGLELTERLQALRPGLKAIISSGYSAEIVQAGVPNVAGVTYLPKPYEAKRLAEIVRDCLDRKT